MSIPEVQKAWVAVKRGTPEQGLELKANWPVSKTLKPREVLVKVQAAALNPVPHVAEFDFAGIIVEASDTDFKKAYQRASKQGSLAEYAVAQSVNIAIRPQNISIVEGSGVSLTALTALQALDEAKLEEGQTLLINGASTAVGAFATQIAKIKGAKVVGIASGKNEAFVRGLGADEFIDYTKVGPLHKHLAKNPPSVKYNVILEAVGFFDPSLYTFSKPYLAPNGVYISVGPQPKLQFRTIWDALRLGVAKVFPSFITGVKPSFRYVYPPLYSELCSGRNFSITQVQSNKDNITRLQKWLAEGKIRPLVDSVYAFDDALKAYERIISSRATGKVVVKVDSSVPDS